MNEPGVGLEGLKEKAKKLIVAGIWFCSMVLGMSLVILIGSLIMNTRIWMKLRKEIQKARDIQ